MMISKRQLKRILIEAYAGTIVAFLSCFCVIWSSCRWGSLLVPKQVRNASLLGVPLRLVGWNAPLLCLFLSDGTWTLCILASLASVFVSELVVYAKDWRKGHKNEH